MSSSIFQIGKLARLTGLAVGTIRYYSNQGLLQPVTRGENGYRYYSEDAVCQVEFIRKAQALGFTLEEIKQILDVRDRGEKPCGLVQSLLDSKITQITAQIEQMALFRAELLEYRRSWLDNPIPESQPLEVCPLVSKVSLQSFSAE